MPFTGWPTVVDTTNVDEDTDVMAVARADIYSALLALNQVVQGRAQANGIPSLDASGYLPLSQSGNITANGLIKIGVDPYSTRQNSQSASVSIAIANHGQTTFLTSTTASQTATLPAATSTNAGFRQRIVNHGRYVATVARNSASDYFATMNNLQEDIYLLPGGHVDLMMQTTNYWYIVDIKNEMRGWLSLAGGSLSGYNLPKSWSAARTSAGLITVTHGLNLVDFFGASLDDYIVVEAGIRGGTGTDDTAVAYSLNPGDDTFQIYMYDETGTEIDSQCWFRMWVEQGFFSGTIV